MLGYSWFSSHGESIWTVEKLFPVEPNVEGFLHEPSTRETCLRLIGVYLDRCGSEVQSNYRATAFVNFMRSLQHPSSKSSPFSEVKARISKRLPLMDFSAFFIPLAVIFLTTPCPLQYDLTKQQLYKYACHLNLRITWFIETAKSLYLRIWDVS